MSLVSAAPERCGFANLSQHLAVVFFNVCTLVHIAIGPLVKVDRDRDLKIEGLTLLITIQLPHSVLAHPTSQDG